MQLNNLTLPTIDANTNRFTANQGYSFDKNGNLIADLAYGGRQFVFNADNKQSEVKDAYDNTIGLYHYDGEGKRVKKVSNSETTIFVYNALGKLVAEYSTQAPASPTISYLTNDTLGSPRVITDNNGDVRSRRDFMPFGEELYAGTTNRTELSKYSISGSDNVRKRFTGYEKDAETGLDFAEARYYDNRFGRFTAVDPLLASGQSADPQTFNRYVYVMNNPTNSTDPTGLWTDNQWSSIDPGFFTPDTSGISFSIAMSPTDFVNTDTGEIVNIPDGIDQVFRADTSQIQRAQQLFNEDLSKYIVILSAMSSNDAFNLHLTRAEFDRLANAVYAESSGGVGESQGIVNVLKNRAAAAGTSLMAQVTDKPPYGVYGVRSDKYETEGGAAADQKRRNVRIAIARGIPGSDTTSGAYWWDGKDFNGRANLTGGHRARYRPGYFFTQPSHDLWNQKSNRVGGTYKYQSTAAIGATTFSKCFNQGKRWNICN